MKTLKRITLLIASCWSVAYSSETPKGCVSPNDLQKLPIYLGENLYRFQASIQGLSLTERDILNSYMSLFIESKDVLVNLHKIIAVYILASRLGKTASPEVCREPFQIAQSKLAFLSEILQNLENSQSKILSKNDIDKILKQVTSESLTKSISDMINESTMFFTYSFLIEPFFEKCNDESHARFERLSSNMWELIIQGEKFANTPDMQKEFCSYLNDAFSELNKLIHDDFFADLRNNQSRRKIQ